MNWFEIKDIDQLDSPVLTVFPERVRQNIQTAIDMVGNVDRLRPHVKTHKSPDATRLMMQAGIEFALLIAIPLIGFIFLGRWLDNKFNHHFFVVLLICYFEKLDISIYLLENHRQLL